MASEFLLWTSGVCLGAGMVFVTDGKLDLALVNMVGAAMTGLQWWAIR